MTNALSLFGHLANHFVTQRENLATEALAYVLDRSEVVRDVFCHLLRTAGAPTLPEGLVFRTQAAGSDGAIPDLVGEDAHARQVLIVESKFWAGLTDAQPVQYLKRLLHEGGEVLIFLVPERRMGLLWNELVARCTSAGFKVSNPTPAPGGALATRIDDRVVLCMVSWRKILDGLIATAEGEAHDAVSDLKQLRGLCEAEDRQAFLPMTSEELTEQTGRRIVQLGDLVDEITAELVRSQDADVTGLRASAGKGWYGKYLRLRGVPSLLHFSAWKWGAPNFAYTPLWLQTLGSDWKESRTDTALITARARHASIEVITAHDGPQFPIYVTPNAEKQRVITDCLGQLRRIAAVLAKPLEDPVPVLEVVE